MRMNRLFAIDGWLYSVMNLIADLVILNLLWLICSLPLFTIGASTTAVYYVLFKRKQEEGGSIVKLFFHAFKENFLVSAGSGLIFFVAEGLILVEFLVLRQVDLPGEFIVRCFLFAALLFCMMVSGFLFPVQAYYKNSFQKLWGNSVRLAVGFLPQALLIALLSAGPLLLFMVFQGNLGLVTFLGLMIGFSGFAWIRSNVVYRIFQKIQCK